MIFDVVRGNVNGEHVIYLRMREPEEQNNATRIEMTGFRLSYKDASTLVKKLSVLLSERDEPKLLH